MSTGRPATGEYDSFYAGYVGRVPEKDILEVLERQKEEIGACVRSVAPQKESFRYAEGKWSIREVLGHMIDAERVFGHRAFCFGRGERAALPGFDENDYVKESGADAVPLAALADEFKVVRDSNLAVLRRLGPDAWSRAGTASGTPVTVRALAWIMAGHPRHHLAVLRERYGVSA